jgi:type I restriction enzyme R subunit
MENEIGADSMDDSSLQFVDQHQHISITGAKLPHWHQNNKIQFITFRLADSLPQEKLAELTAFKEQWLAAHPQPWDQKTKDEYDYTIRRKIDRWLDQGFGECILQREDIRQIVANTLLLYHGRRYNLYRFVIMPNHVHLLLSPIGEEVSTRFIGSVKQYTANAINQALGRKGQVWQRNFFDRLVRDGNNFEAYVNYINQNPRYLPPDSYTLGGTL